MTLCKASRYLTSVNSFKNIRQKAFDNIKCQTSVHTEGLMSDRAQNIEQAAWLNSSLTQENTRDVYSTPHISQKDFLDVNRHKEGLIDTCETRQVKSSRCRLSNKSNTHRSPNREFTFSLRLLWKTFIWHWILDIHLHTSWINSRASCINKPNSL